MKIYRNSINNATA